MLITVRDRDKAEIIPIARKFSELGFTLYATLGTAAALGRAGIEARAVGKLHEGHRDIWELLDGGKLQYLISTSSKGVLPQRDSVQLRRHAVERSIACLTSLDTAAALVRAIAGDYSQKNVELINVADLPSRRRKLHFVKLRTGDNDYIYFDCFDQVIESPESLSVQLSSRRKSIGGDGIVLIEPSDIADAAMRMYNADGSPGEVSGNAMRCVAKYLYESGRVRRESMRILTGAGVKALKLYVRDDEVYSVEVSMGLPDFAIHRVPMLPVTPEVARAGEAVDQPYAIGGGTFRITCLSMGNPHCVVFVDDVDGVDVAKYGPILERAPIFPERANISFAQMRGATWYRVRVWERGIGETRSCGTAACAVAAAAVRLGMAPMDRDIQVGLPGSQIIIRLTNDDLTMTGDAQRDFEGDIELWPAAPESQQAVDSRQEKAPRNPKLRRAFPANRPARLSKPRQVCAEASASGGPRLWAAMAASRPFPHRSAPVRPSIGKTRRTPAGGDVDRQVALAP